MPLQERLGMTNVGRLQQYDHKVSQGSYQRDARNMSEALSYSLRLPACPPAAETGLMPANAAQGFQAGLIQALAAHRNGGTAFVGSTVTAAADASLSQQQQEQQQQEQQQQVRAEAKVLRARRMRLRAQKPVAAAPSEVARHTKLATPGRNPGGRGTAAICTACKQARIGHPKRGCPTHCMKCKKQLAGCNCPVKT